MNKTNSSALKVSEIAENITGSEIIKLADEVNKLKAKGETIYNLTIGDFDSTQFPIPTEMKDSIIQAYQDGLTNYPPAKGTMELRKAVASLLKERGNLDYSPDDIIITGGGRPIIFNVYATIIDPEDTVIFAVPSWNNNHYTYLNRAKICIIEGKPENNFMPSAIDIEPFIKEANLIALCSPQNPTGTVFTKKGLEEICDLVLAENQRRGENEKPLYVMYDQIYWELVMEGTTHYNPVSVRPAMKDYTIFVDGISKSLSATGVRLGWAFGPHYVMEKMKSLNTHLGAWGAKAEQIGVANFLNNKTAYANFIDGQRKAINTRLQGFYNGFQTLKSEGFKVDAIAPQAAIYLTIKFDLFGLKTPDGKTIERTEDITRYILNEAKLAVVPFYAFGTDRKSPWYRLSIGTAAVEDIEIITDNLRKALQKLS